MSRLADEVMRKTMQNAFALWERDIEVLLGVIRQAQAALEYATCLMVVKQFEKTGRDSGPICGTCEVCVARAAIAATLEREQEPASS